MSGDGEYGPPDIVGERSDLARDLKACSELLAQHGEEHWSSRIDRVLADDGTLLRERSVREVMSWFGGMGSFNDILICAHNGHRIEQKHEDQINKEVRDLQSAIYNSAHSILRALR
ncbi:MAG: DUF6966 domain-containing protein [Phycisphaerales bacterium JB039]